MATASFSSGDRKFAAPASARRRDVLRCGLTLIEVLVVLFIISILFALLFPGLQAARARALVTSCQNNLRQVSMALSQSINNLNRFPEPGRWTCEILKFIEEWPLADETKNGVAKGAVLPCPRLFHCPAQANVMSTVAEVRVCQYVVVVDRPTPRKGTRVRWEMLDRPILTDDEKYDPWYAAPEMSFAEQQQMLATKRGPHLAGLFYDSQGQPRGGD